MAIQPKRQRLRLEAGEENVQRQYKLRNRQIFFETKKKERGYVKHAILQRYLQAWLPKLCFCNWYKKIIYVDGFSGTGKHVHKNEDGSPLVAYQAAANHCYFSRWNTKIKMRFIEKDKNNAKELRKNLRNASRGHDRKKSKSFFDKKRSPDFQKFSRCILQPGFRFLRMQNLLSSIKHKDNTTYNVLAVASKDAKFNCRFYTVSWKVMSGDFCENVTTLLDKYKGLPMLVFADPYGYSQTPMKILRLIMDRCGPIDLILSVMDSFALRFGLGEGGAKEKAMTKLLGIKPKIWRSILSQELSAEHKRTKLMKIIKRQLSDQNNLLALQFGMRRGRTNTHVYHIFYATRHIRGMEAMKEAMWRQSQQADRLVFSEFKKEKGVMVDFKKNRSERKAIVVSILKKAFKGKRKVTGEKIEKYVLKRTIYKVEKVPLRTGLKKYERVNSNKKRLKFEDRIYDFPIL